MTPPWIWSYFVFLVGSLHLAKLRYQVTQERFNGQSVSLSITNERIGDLNECLTSAKSIHAASINKLQLELAVLQEQKTAQRDVDTRHRQESDAAVIAQFQQQLARQISDSEDVILTLERRAGKAECMVDSLRAAIERKGLQFREQDLLVNSLMQQVCTISERYKGDLINSEAALDHFVINKAPSLQARNFSKPDASKPIPRIVPHTGTPWGHVDPTGKRTITLSSSPIPSMDELPSSIRFHKRDRVSPTSPRRVRPRVQSNSSNPLSKDNPAPKSKN